MSDYSLQKEMERAETEIPFNTASYACMKGMSDNQATAFAINHLNLHMMQVVGKLAAVSGNVEHDEPLDIQQVASLIPEMLIYTLRLARVADLSAAQLEGGLDTQYAEWKRLYG